MSAELRVLLENILESAGYVRQYVQGITHDEFLADVQVQDAVLRRIEIIGEAVKNLPADWRAAHPVLPWSQIARMRDLLIHRYFSVDLDLTWQTTQSDIPELERQVALLLADLPLP
jgi:uncharacterized protein with HEPN domain